MTKKEKEVLKAVVSHCKEEFSMGLEAEFDNLDFKKQGAEDYFKTEKTLQVLMGAVLFG